MGRYPACSLQVCGEASDLLTLLGMEAVDEIIVSASQYGDILSNTKLPLTIVATSRNTFGFAVCAAKEGKINAGLMRKLLNAPASLIKELGIDSWEKP